MFAEQNPVDKLAPTTIGKVAFGIRYETQFALSDTAGRVIDAVLRTDGSRFSAEVFPNTSIDPTEYILNNPANENYLRVNPSDTILLFGVKTRSLKTVQKLGEDFAEFVLRPLRQIARVRGIVRIGMILHLDEARTAIKQPPIERYIAKDFPNATTFQMRVTQRLPAFEALSKKRVDDVRNVIYTMTESEEGKVAIAIDYQEYFRPPLDGEEFDARAYANFVSRGLNHFEGEFEKWFKNTVDKAVAS